MSTALASLLKNSASALRSPCLPATHTVLTHLGLGCDPSRAWLPPRQKLPGSDFHLAEARGGWGPQVSWEGQLCLSPPSPEGPTPDGLIVQQGVLHPSVTRAEPQSLGRSQHHQRLVGWEGLAGLHSSTHRQQHRRGVAGGTQPDPASVQRGQVRSLQCPLLPLRRVPGHAWGPRAVWSGSSTRPHGQDTAVGLGPASRSPTPRPACQPTFLCPFHTVDTGALVSAVPQPARTGEEGQAEEQPSPHRSQGPTQSIYFG